MTNTETCPLGEECPNWKNWTDEIGALIKFIDESLARLQHSQKFLTLPENIAFRDGQIDMLHVIKNKL